MPQINSLGEAILRALGGFGQQVGGQMQANELFNQQAQHQDLWNRLNFEAGQDYRQQGLDLRGQGLQATQNWRDQSQANWQAEFDQRYPVGPQLPEPQTFNTLGAWEADFAAKDLPGFIKYRGALKEAERPSATAEKPTGGLPTGVQGKVAEQFLEQRGTPINPDDPWSQMSYPPITGGTMDSLSALLGGGQQAQPETGLTAGQPMWQQYGYSSREEALATLEEDYRAGRIPDSQYQQWRKMFGGK